MSQDDGVAVVICRTGSDPAGWDECVGELSVRHRVILWRHREPPRRRASSEDVAADLAAGLDRQGVARAHLVGLGNGCALALRAAARYPDRVGSLTLSAGVRTLAALAAALPLLQMPVLLIVGGEDANGHGAVLRRLLASSPDARLAAIPRTRRAPHRECPRAWSEAVLEFVGHIAAGSADVRSG